LRSYEPAGRQRYAARLDSDAHVVHYVRGYASRFSGWRGRRDQLAGGGSLMAQRFAARDHAATFRTLFPGCFKKAQDQLLAVMDVIEQR